MCNSYFIDIDGVLVAHSGRLSSIKLVSSLLKDALDLLNAIADKDGKIILTTGRRESQRDITEKQLSSLGIFYDQLVMGLNRGPRILINDLKPNSKFNTAYAFNVIRNGVLDVAKKINPYDERPWGSYSTLALSQDYHIKEIVVLPGQRSSLQSHQCRSEYWVVIKGTGVATLQDEEVTINPGDIIHVPLEAKHRVANTGSEDLVFVEIQLGENFSESDITRYEDNYGRV